jgi:hypothetical protein
VWLGRSGEHRVKISGGKCVLKDHAADLCGSVDKAIVACTRTPSSPLWASVTLQVYHYSSLSARSLLCMLCPFPHADQEHQSWHCSAQRDMRKQRSGISPHRLSLETQLALAPPCAMSLIRVKGDAAPTCSFIRLDSERGSVCRSSAMNQACRTLLTLNYSCASSTTH